MCLLDLVSSCLLESFFDSVKLALVVAAKPADVVFLFENAQELDRLYNLVVRAIDGWYLVCWDPVVMVFQVCNLAELG